MKGMLYELSGCISRSWSLKRWWFSLGGLSACWVEYETTTKCTEAEWACVWAQSCMRSVESIHYVYTMCQVLLWCQGIAWWSSRQGPYPQGAYICMGTSDNKPTNEREKSEAKPSAVRRLKGPFARGWQGLFWIEYCDCCFCWSFFPQSWPPSLYLLAQLWFSLGIYLLVILGNVTFSRPFLNISHCCLFLFASDQF